MWQEFESSLYHVLNLLPLTYCSLQLMKMSKHKNKIKINKNQDCPDKPLGSWWVFSLWCGWSSSWSAARPAAGGTSWLQLGSLYKRCCSSLKFPPPPSTHTHKIKLKLKNIKANIHLCITHAHTYTCTRYSLERRGKRTCSIRWAMCSWRTSLSCVTQAMTASNTYKHPGKV